MFTIANYYNPAASVLAFKRDNFKFRIVNYPDLSGNISHKCAYGVFVSELLRYSKVCSNERDFEARHMILFDKLVKQNYDTGQLKKYLRKVKSSLN